MGEGAGKGLEVGRSDQPINEESKGGVVNNVYNLIMNSTINNSNIIITPNNS